MAYQSKTWSLSDEVVEAVEAARLNGETPNQLLRRVLVEPRLDELLQTPPQKWGAGGWRLILAHCREHEPALYDQVVTIIQTMREAVIRQKGDGKE